MNNDIFPSILVCFFVSVVSYVIGGVQEAGIMEKQAVATHNAHYVLNETNGTSTFKWNNQ